MEMKVSSCTGSDDEYAAAAAAAMDGRVSCAGPRIHSCLASELKAMLVVLLQGVRVRIGSLSVGIRAAGPCVVRGLGRVLMKRREFTMSLCLSRPFSTSAPA